jgi:uncharacterized repeat protein (TIGR02543 family)
MKKRMVVLCVAMVAALITIPCADAYWEITQLTSNDLDDQYPDINDSGWVTWLMRGAGGGAFKIFLHDGSEPHCIADEYVGIPHISNNGDVVWNHFREDDSGIVYLHNGSETLNLSGNGSAYGSSINSSGQVVWSQYDSSPPGYDFYDYDIMLYSGGVISPITHNEIADEKPCIDADGTVYWSGVDFSYLNFLGVYDGTVQHPFTGDCSIFIDRTNTIPCSRGYAAWNCRDSEDGDIYLYNGADVINLTENIEAGGLSPQVNDNGWVVWVGVTWSADGFPNYEIMLYDGATITQLTHNDLKEVEPKINNHNQVVWHGDDGNDFEIFMYENGHILQLTDNCYDDQFPRINDHGEVAWFGNDGNDYEIFVRRWQTDSTPTWAHTYGHTSNEGFSSATEIAAGDLIVAGTTRDGIAAPGDIWLSRLDAGGNVLWQRTYGGEDDDSVAKVLLASEDNGILMAGSTASFGAGETDVWLMKLDYLGMVQWQKTFGGTQRDWTGDLLEVHCSGGYILAGTSMGYDASNQGDIWIMKLDNSGSMQWQKRYGTDSGGEQSCAIEQTGDGGYIVSGTTNAFGTSNGDIWLLKLDAAGDILWEKTYGSTWVETGAKVVQTGDGGYVVACESYSFSADMNLSDIWVLKLDASGDIQWQKAYIIPCNNGLSAVRQISDGNYIVAGNRDISFSSTTRDNRGLLMKLSAAGDVIWTKGYACSIDDLLMNDAGGYTTVGYSAEFGVGQQDGCVLRLDAYGEIHECDPAEILTVSVVDTDVSAVETSADLNDTADTGMDTPAAAADFSSYRRDICEPKPLISLPRTGQTSAYATGDDGDIQSGVAWPEPRFTDNEDGTITDNLTGLTWLKDATCLGEHAWSDEPDSYPARAAIADLNANPGNYACTGYTGDHTDWRLPSINELYSLVNIGAENCALWLLDRGFQDVEHASTYDRYWTDTENSHNPYFAWIVQFNEYTYNYAWVSAIGKDDENWVWPVRGREDSLPDEQYPAGVWAPGASGDGGVMWPNPRLTDNGDGTVTDNLTGLMWLKDAECFDPVPWADTFALAQTLTASSGCEDYTADYTDWRVPNQKELLSLVDFGNWRHALPTGHPFIMGSRGINALSSSTVAGRDTDFYWVSLDSGLTYGAGKASAGNYRLLPVRTPTLTVTFVEGENGSIAGDLVQYVHLGEDCTQVTANPAGGYRFAGWTGDYSGTENPLTVTQVAADMTITANFLPDAAYTVTFAAGENGSVTGDLHQTVLHGDHCTAVTAVADAGYYFVGWQGGYTGTDNPLTLTNVTSDMALTAGFRGETCFGDGDSDGDVDGLDLKGVSFDSGLFELDRLAENFGRVNCF